jgi:hypothetical protein
VTIVSAALLEPARAAAAQSLNKNQLHCETHFSSVLIEINPNANYEKEHPDAARIRGCFGRCDSLFYSLAKNRGYLTIKTRIKSGACRFPITLT